MPVERDPARTMPRAAPSSSRLNRMQMAVQQPRFGLSFALHLNGATAFKLKTVLQALVDASRDLNASWNARGFHAAGEVHGIAPEIVDELSDANDASDDWTAVKPNAQLEAQSLLLPVLLCGFHHSECHGRHSFGVVGAGLGQAADRHVTISDGFDFFDAQFTRCLIEQAEQAIQHLDNLRRGYLARKRRESDDIAKQDCDVRKAVSDLVFTLL